MKLRLRLIACLWFSSVLTCPTFSQENNDKPVLLEQAAKLEAQAGEVGNRENEARTTITQSRQKLLELQQTVLKLQRLLSDTQKSITEQEAKLKEQEAAATKAEEARVQAAAAVEAATKALAEAQAKLDEANKAAETAAAAATTVGDSMKTMAAAIAEMQTKAATTTTEVATHETEVNGVRESLTMIESSAKQAYEEKVSLLKQAEALRSQAGEWVSFAAEVAPIFQARCIACHNARTAKGRLNMESYAALMKGGESGAAVEIGNFEASNLCMLIADGSMPQDADPLTPEQIALVNRWVALGARLDAGKEPAAPLIQVMPKLRQPDPPEQYGLPVPVNALDFNSDGSLLATSGYHEVLLWSTADGSLVKRLTNVAERVYDIDFHPDGTKLVIAGGTPGQIGEVKVFTIADGQLVADLVTVDDVMFGAAFSPDGTKLAACGADRSIRIFDVAKGEQTTLIEDHADWVLSIAWSPDGTKLVSASRDKTAKVFDAATGDAQITFNGHGEVVTSVAVLSDNAQAVTSGRDQKLRVWKLADGAETKAIGGFGKEVAQVALHSTNRIFSACADQKARSHQPDGTAVANYEGHQDWIYSIALHEPTGKLATGSFDGEVRLWTIDEPKTVLTWKAAPGYVSTEQAAK